MLDSKPETGSSTVEGKDDAWDRQNDPERFGGELNYVINELPQSGRAAREAWPSSYFPTYMDSINHRWMGNNELSPAEKYDRAFNGWTPSSTFESLRPFDPGNCEEGEWDSEYYDSLGPLAAYISKQMGNLRSRDGLDTDGDGEIDECEDFDGVATWWGLCHAWVPAAMLEERPLRTVTYNGITFHSGDLEALLILAYHRTSSVLIGGRCSLFDTREEMADALGCRLPEEEAFEGDTRPECTEEQLTERVIERDDNGAPVQDACSDTNAGSFHVIMTNYLGLMQQSFAYDRTYNFEVWNQPIVAFEIDKFEEITASQANIILGEEGESYHHNDEAVSFFEVETSLTYITESNIYDTPPEASRYERQDHYSYILEIDAEGEIIGGEWTGDSLVAHPDFLWEAQARTTSSVYNLDLDNVRMLLNMSREPEVPQNDAIQRVAGEGGMDIPDNDELGVTSILTVSDPLVIGGLQIELDITHSYIGDLLIELRHEELTRVIHNNSGGSSDNIQTTLTVPGFTGFDAAGEWSLHIIDSAARDTGRINAWHLIVTPGSEAVDVETTGEASDLTLNETTAATIPDNNTEGISQVISTTENFTVGSVVVVLTIRHEYIGDLNVTLSHEDVEYTLHDNSGGGTDDIIEQWTISAFEGFNVQGDWTLQVTDNQNLDEGTLETWGLTFRQADETETLLVEDSESPESFPGQGGLTIPDNNETGISSDSIVPSGITGTAFASVNITHTWRGDLTLNLTHGEQTWMLHDKEGSSSDNIIESFPLDPEPEGALEGTWTLEVIDHSNLDEGTLTSWSLVVNPE
jgi:subtilisin-like proprotein convertase family protein